MNKKYKYNKKWCKNNPEKVKKYYQKCKITRKKWRENNPEYFKEYYKRNNEELRRKKKQYYKENKEKVREKNNEYRNKIVQYVNNYKLSKGCTICGYNKCASALDFHHNRDKEFHIGQFHGNLEKLKIEMEKCIVLCADCHRELHTEKEVKKNVEKD